MVAAFEKAGERERGRQSGPPSPPKQCQQLFRMGMAADCPVQPFTRPPTHRVAVDALCDLAVQVALLGRAPGTAHTCNRRVKS